MQRIAIPSHVLTFLKFSLLVALSSLSLLVFASDPSSNTIVWTDQEREFIEQHPVIIVGGEQDWPPLDFVKDGKHTGFSQDYLDLLSHHTGLQFNIVIDTEWHDLITKIQQKEIDLLPMIFWSADRSHYLHYTQPYLVIRQYIFVHEDNQSINNMADLHDKTLVIPKNYAHIDLLKSQYPEIHLLIVNTPLEAIDAVITKQADAMFENTGMIRYLQKEQNITGLKPAFASDMGLNKMYMATRQDWPILRDIIQKGLEHITTDEHHIISTRWMTPNAKQHKHALSLSKEQTQYLEQKKVIKACVDPDWAPIEHLQSGSYTGIGADYLTLLQQKIAIPISVVPTRNWDESLMTAQNRECDIFIMSMNVEPQRSFMNHTSPYLDLPVVLATKQDVVFVSKLTEIANKKIGLIENCSLAATIIDANPNINFELVPTRHIGLEKVKRGDLFGLVDNLYSLSHDIQTHYYDDLKIGGNLGVNWQLGVATRNDEPILHAIFEQAVLSISEPDKRDILTRWTSIKYVEKFDKKLAWQLSIAFTIIFSVLYFRHRRVVRHKTEITLKNNELAKINRQLLSQKEEAQHHADHDFLTELPNRKRISEILQGKIDEAHQHQEKLAILFLDLDRFKHINDSFGHAAGDDVLKLTADRLKNRLRATDILARLGGDEFLMILDINQDLDAVDAITQSIIAEVQQPILIKEQSQTLSASIGIAIYPDDSDDALTLIKHADSAMYAAKQHKDRYRYFTKELSAQSQRRINIERALSKAISKAQLSLNFQPQIDLETQHIVGVEALLRWHHPQWGFVSPAEFIPIAEESGHITEIGEWVFREACQQLADWRRQGFELNSMAINVSSVQFSQPNINEVFKNIIAEFDISPNQIEIEITERYLMADTEQNKHILQSLRETGFRISVDDFGTGYSSMSYLKTLPLDIIKIDKSFIDDIPHSNNDLQITKAILALSHSLGYTVIAEGIENEEQLITLQSMACDIGQGYYFDKPLPADALLARYTNTR